MTDLIHEKTTPEDRETVNLRPQKLKEFVGQEHLKELLSLAIESAKITGNALDHVLLSGSPGLGKTTLSTIIANELGLNIYVTSAPIIEKPADLADLLITLEPRDILFIDEIHGLPKMVEEVLYSAMEDYQLDVSIGRGKKSSAFRLDLPPFTLIGATTLAGLLAAPLRNRFGLQLDMEFYTQDELSLIVQRSAKLFGLEIDKEASGMLAQRSRGTARLVNRLLKRVRDLAVVNHTTKVTVEYVQKIMDILRIDNHGMDSLDRKILRVLDEVYDGKPVGVKTMAASLSVASETIAEVHEPYLLSKGFLARTSRGRTITEKGRKYLAEVTLL
jgi:Holliday junction DNA helicase RuvB